jgi:hypothetical protein
MLEENKEIKFNETLEIEDLQVVNYYSFKRQKKHLFNQIIFISMSVLIIGLAIHNKDIPILIFGCATLLFALVLFMPLYKRWIYSIVKKKAAAPMNIKASFDNDGFHYLLEHENPEDFPKFEYNQVAHVVDLPEYILMFFGPNTIAILKKNSCSEIDALRALLQEKYQDGRYVIIDKMPR